MPSTSVAATKRPSSRNPVPATLPTEGYCRLPLVLAVLPIGKTTWLDGVRNGRFPKPVHLGRSVLWKAHEIRRVLADIEAGTLPSATPKHGKDAADQGEQQGSKGKRKGGKANAAG